MPVVNAVVNAGSGSRSVSPGCLISIYGAGLAASITTANSVPLPLLLGSTSVQVGGFNAPLLFVSPTQINAQVPFEVIQAGLSLVVRTSAGTSTAYPLQLGSTAPAIFSIIGNGEGRGLFLNSSFQLVDSLVPGSSLILYATGLGATTPSGTTGSGGAITEPFNRSVVLPDLYVGEKKAQVFFAGLAPGFPGVYQINAVVPGELQTDRVFLENGLYQSNYVSFSQSYQNTSTVYVKAGASAGTAFDFDTGVSPSQQAAIESAVGLGNDFFRSQNLGGSGTGHVFALSGLDALANIYSEWESINPGQARSTLNGGAAVSGPGVIFVNTASQVWQDAGTILQSKVVIHELFHLLQYRLVAGAGLIGPGSIPTGGPRWLIEGSAELMGYRGIDAAGLYPFSKALTDQTAQARLISVSLSSLETLSGVNAAGPNGGYPLMFSAVGYLTKDSGLPPLGAFWAAIGSGTPWQAAFQTAFGRNIEAFYSDFEAYRAATFPPLVQQQLSGNVTDVSGRAYAAIAVYACPQNPPGACSYVSTRSDGTWALAVPQNNTYIISFGRTTDGAHPDGFYNGSGFISDLANATPIVVAGSGISGLNVRLPFSNPSVP